MSYSLHRAVVTPMLQTVVAGEGFLAKAEEHFRAAGQDVDALLAERLATDMLPFSFQIQQMASQSAGAVQGALAGELTMKPGVEAQTYAELRAILADARASLESVDPAALDAVVGRPFVLHMRQDVLFTADEFLTIFALPNFMFHATTAYGILRARGAPIGKRDFLAGVLAPERMREPAGA